MNDYSHVASASGKYKSTKTKSCKDETMLIYQSPIWIIPMGLEFIFTFYPGMNSWTIIDRPMWDLFINKSATTHPIRIMLVPLRSLKSSVKW